METYVVLINFTQQGMTNIKSIPARIETNRQEIEAAGGKLLGWYLTMGRYDVVVVLQLSDSKTAASLLLSIGAFGNVRTETLRAFTVEEFGEIVAGLS